jgi:hypothetical protein
MPGGKPSAKVFVIDVTEASMIEGKKSKSLPPGFDDPNCNWYVLERATWWMVEEVKGKDFRVPMAVKFSDCSDGRLIHEEKIELCEGEMEATTIFDAHRRTPVPFEGYLIDHEGREHKTMFTMQRLIAAWSAAALELKQVRFTDEDSAISKKIFAAMLGLVAQAVGKNAEGPFTAELTVSNGQGKCYVEAVIWKGEDGDFLICGEPWKCGPIDPVAEVTLTLTDGEHVCLTETLSPVQ